MGAEVSWDVAAGQFLSALRANRSQRELSRSLGYRSNVLCNWEAQRRFPSAERTLAICAKLGIDATAALARFAPECAGLAEGLRVGPWLNALRRTTSVASLAR